MPSLTERLGLVRTTAAARAAILQDALVHASHDELSTLLTALNATGATSGLQLSIRRLHEVPAEGRLDIVRNAPLESVTSAIIRRRDPQSVANLLEAIRLTWRAEALPGVTPLLGEAEPELAIDAARTLLHVVLGRLGPLGRRPCREATRAGLDNAIAQALETYREHRLDDVLMAAAWMAGSPGPRLAAILADPQHEAVFAIRSVPERLYQGPVRRSLLNWLRVEALSGPVGRWLSRVHGTAAWEDVLAAGHLLRAPTRRRGLRRADRPMQCLPELAECTQLTPAAQAAVPDLIVGLDLTSRTRARRLGDLIALDDPIARHRVVHRLVAIDDDLQTWLAPFVRDRAQSVARAALHALIRASGEQPIPLAQALTAGERSGHPPVVATARRRASAFGLDAFFARWVALPEVTRLTVAMRHLAREPQQMLHRLAEQVRMGSRIERLTGIALARRLDLSARLADELARAATEDDARVASAAISALSGQKSDEAINAMVGGLTHDDARVRANAIEALSASVDDEILDRIADQATSVDNRPRANAVRVLMRPRPMLGLTELRDMLSDHRPMHRVSALWVAQHARDERVLEDVRRIEVDEPIPNIRTRASVARRFIEAARATAAGARS